MSIKYVCDVCGKEVNQSEVAVSMMNCPSEWAVITVSFPVKAHKPPKPGEPYIYHPYPYDSPKTFITCSQVCAEKALDAAKGLLRPAFEKVTRVG